MGGPPLLSFPCKLLAVLLFLLCESIFASAVLILTSLPSFAHSRIRSLSLNLPRFVIPSSVLRLRLGIVRLLAGLVALSR